MRLRTCARARAFLALSGNPHRVLAGGWLYALAGDEAYAAALVDARPAIVPGLVLKKFADLEIGLVDASIVALAERLDVQRILTIDADFSAVRMGKRWNRAFDLAVPLS